MQLHDAIEGWVDAHSAGLSTSTRRDIADIATAAQACGYADLGCGEIREPQRLEIIAEADTSSTLNATAIGQFLAIVVEWGADADKPGAFAALADTPDDSVAEPIKAVASIKPDEPTTPVPADDLPSDTDEWLIADDLDGATSPVVADAVSDSWLTDEPDDDPDVEDEPAPIDDGWLNDDLITFDDEPLDKGGVDDEIAGFGDVIVDDLHVDPWADELPPIGEPLLEATPVADVPVRPKRKRKKTKKPKKIEPVTTDSHRDMFGFVDPDPAGSEPTASQPTDADPADPETPAVSADERLTDEDDLDADELRIIDADLTTTDEHQLDADELRIIDADLDDLLPVVDEPAIDEVVDVIDDDDPDVQIVIDATDPVTTPVPEAASFLRAIDQSAPNRTAFGDLANETATASADLSPVAAGQDTPASESGIFSEAAQYEPGRSVDWLTVLYFGVAAICFAFVIYLYLSG